MARYAESWVAWPVWPPWLRQCNLPILAGIQPAEFRCKEVKLSQARRTKEPGHLPHSMLTRPPSGDSRRLKSRHQFVSAAQQLFTLSDNNNVRTAHWVDHQWNAEWADNITRLFHPNTDTNSPLVTLSRRAWFRFYSLRTGVGRFTSSLYKWRMAFSVACECGAEKQTVDHVVLQCSIHRPPHGLHGLTVPGDETIEWLLNICPEI